MEPIRVFVGFDPRESVAYHVLTHSILSRCSAPVSFTPLSLHSVRSIFDRPRDPSQSTDFAFSRFLVPALCAFEGWSLFLDCDILAQDDLTKLWAQRDDQFAVQVVKHDYTPAQQVKFLNQVQTVYPRKNWSSVLLFNNARCKRLTPKYVSSASGLELHRFSWLDDSDIGELDQRWNHLVGEYAPNPHAALVHFTNGGPYFAAYRQCEYAQAWYAELRAAQAGLQSYP